MEKSHPLNDLMATTMEKIRELTDANTVVGEPIREGDITLIPISKISFGFTTGGTEFGRRNQKPDQGNAFGGGGGAGVKIVPVAFLVISGASVKMLPMAIPADSTADRALDMVPELLEKLTTFLENRKKEKESAGDQFQG